MTERIKHKHGDTFVAAGLYKDSLGAPVNITTAGIDIESAFRIDGSAAVFWCTIELEDQGTSPGVFEVRRQTADWPGDDGDELLWDIQFTTPDGDIQSTETIIIVVQRDVTPEEEI